MPNCFHANMGTSPVTINETTTTSKIYGYTVLIGIGSGAYVQAGYSVAQAKVDPSKVPSSVGFMSLAQTVGVVIALAISGSVFINSAVDGMTPFLPGVPREQVKGAVAGSTSKLFESLTGETRANVLHALIHAMNKTYTLIIVAGALTVICSVFMKVSSPPLVLI